MREQQNPSTPELHKPLLFAPSELLTCGLRGRASPSSRRRPYGGRRAVLAHVAGDGVGASPGRVGTHGHQLLRARSRLRFEGESELACAVEAGYGDLPRPNVAAQRATSGHLHLGWNLRTPVHRGRLVSTGLRAMLFCSTSARHRIRHGLRHTSALAGRRLCPCVANGRLRYMLIGYARVSKADGSQPLDLQRDALQAA